MHFSFDEDQQEFAELVRDYLNQTFPASRLRDQWENGGTAGIELLSGLAELGAMASVIPEEFDGLGRDGLDLALSFEWFGYFGVAEPLAFTSGVAAPFIVRYASEEAKRTWLPRFAEGRALATVQLEENALVVGATIADVFLVARGNEVHLFDRDQVSVTHIDSQDPTLGLGRLEAACTPDSLISDEPGALEYLQTLTRSAVASILVGVSQRMLDMTQEYMLLREQFGRVIGSFQSLKHRMADTAAHIEAARSLSWFAHYSHVRDQGQPAVAASLAKSAASTAVHSTGYAALQHHGGIGFTWEYDLHMWLQRGYALERLFGTADRLRADVGAHVIDRVGRRGAAVSEY